MCPRATRLILSNPKGDGRHFRMEVHLDICPRIRGTAANDPRVVSTKRCQFRIRMSTCLGPIDVCNSFSSNTCMCDRYLLFFILVGIESLFDKLSNYRFMESSLFLNMSVQQVSTWKWDRSCAFHRELLSTHITLTSFYNHPLKQFWLFQLGNFLHLLF